MYYDYDIYDSGIDQPPIYYREGNLELVCMHFLAMFFQGDNKNWLYEVKGEDDEDLENTNILVEDSAAADKKKIAKQHLKKIIMKIQQLELINCPPREDIKTTLKHLKKLKLVKEDYSGFT